MSLNIKEFTIGPFAQHPLVVSDDESKEAFLVDVGMEDGSISRYITEHNLHPIGIYNTHAHIDHVAACKDIQDKYKIPFFMGKFEEPVLAYAPTSAAQYGFPFQGAPKVQSVLVDGDKFMLGKYSFTVIATPGHTPGGVCYYCAAEKLLLAGDTLFAGSIGRTDLPGGDSTIMMQSLEKLKVLPADTVVYCGHGDTTTIGQECQTNPFLQ